MSKFKLGDVVEIVDFNVSDAHELLSICRESDLVGRPWIVQELKDGEGYFRHSVLLQMFVHRRVDYYEEDDEYDGEPELTGWWFCDKSLKLYCECFPRREVTKIPSRGDI